MQKIKKIYTLALPYLKQNRDSRFIFYRLSLFLYLIEVGDHFFNVIVVY